MFFLKDTSSVTNNMTNYNYHAPLQENDYQNQSLLSNCLNKLDTFDIVQGIGHFLVYSARYLGAYFVDLFMIIAAMTLWLGTNQFVQEAINVSIKERKSMKYLSMYIASCFLLINFYNRSSIGTFMHHGSIFST
jgi:hypothetical protein